MERYEDGVLRQLWDYVARKYTEYDETGAIVIERDFNAIEHELADQADAAAAAEAAREAQRAAVRSIITDMQAEKARADAIIPKNNNQITPGDTKDLARAVKRLADASADLARLVKDL